MVWQRYNLDAFLNGRIFGIRWLGLEYHFEPCIRVHGRTLSECIDAITRQIRDPSIAERIREHPEHLFILTDDPAYDPDFDPQALFETASREAEAKRIRRDRDRLADLARRLSDALAWAKKKDASDDRRRKKFQGFRARRKNVRFRHRAAVWLRLRKFRETGDLRGWRGEDRSVAERIVHKAVFDFDRLGTAIGDENFEKKEKNQAIMTAGDLKTKRSLIQAYENIVSNVEATYGIDRATIRRHIATAAKTRKDFEDCPLALDDEEANRLTLHFINLDEDQQQAIFERFMDLLGVIGIYHEFPQISFFIDRKEKVEKWGNVAFLNTEDLSIKVMPVFSSNFYRSRQAIKTAGIRDCLDWYCSSFEKYVTMLVLSNGWHPIERAREGIREMAGMMRDFRTLIEEDELCRKYGLELFWRTSEVTLHEAKGDDEEKKDEDSNEHDDTGVSALGYYVHPHVHPLFSRKWISDPSELDALKARLRELATAVGFKNYCHMSSFNGENPGAEAVKYVCHGFKGKPLHTYPGEVLAHLEYALHKTRMFSAFGRMKKKIKRFNLSERKPEVGIAEDGYPSRFKPSRRFVRKTMQQDGKPVFTLLHRNRYEMMDRVENRHFKKHVDFVGLTAPAAITGSTRVRHLVFRMAKGATLPDIEHLLGKLHPTLGTAENALQSTREDWNAKAGTKQGKDLGMKILPSLPSSILGVGGNKNVAHSVPKFGMHGLPPPALAPPSGGIFASTGPP